VRLQGDAGDDTPAKTSRPPEGSFRRPLVSPFRSRARAGGENRSNRYSAISEM
jgi:hypothetical protein